MNTRQTRLILVGGFLGAGKTTLLWEAARRLAAGGTRVGLITNDQAPELVDTALLSRAGVAVGEVAGSCFCCNFEGFLAAVARVRREADADVLIAEPVGSCTDLSATILQPIKDAYRRELVLAPLTVLADPGRLEGILDGGTAGLHPSAAYIYRKQIEEADIVAVSKADLLAPEVCENLRERVRRLCPAAEVLCLSSRTGAGLDAWLEKVLAGSGAGQRIAAVDYDVYAEGEAVLGWLNATLALHAEQADWRAFAERLLRSLAERFETRRAAVGHVKLLVSAGNGFVVGNLTGAAETLSLRGTPEAAAEAALTLNARVEMPPATLEAVVREALNQACDRQVTAEVKAWRCLSPGRPKPTHRFEHVVGE